MNFLTTIPGECITYRYVVNFTALFSMKKKTTLNRIPPMTSDKTLARIAGLLYLVVIGTGLFAEVFVRQAVRVARDAMATARNIQSSEALFRSGVFADLINFVVGLPCVLIVYLLFKHVNQSLAKLAIIFVVIQTAVIAVNLLNQISSLLFLGNDIYLHSFQPDQLAALSVHALDLQAYGYGIGLVFFGFYCLIIGYLIFKSDRVSPVIGILYALAGLGYLLNSSTLLLFPDNSSALFPYFAIVSFLGEMSFCLWLVIIGVRLKSSDKLSSE